uniref:EamA family transporter n=1 Tax=Halocatena halophila TaxID=2814576 RepID=UPI0038B24FEF
MGWYLRSRRSTPRQERAGRGIGTEWIEVFIGGVLFVAAHHTLLFIGQQYVTSAVTSSVVSLDPVLAAVFSSIRC